MEYATLALSGRFQMKEAELYYRFNGSILKSKLRKKSNSSDTKKCSSVFISFFLHLKPDFKYMFFL